MRVAILGPLSVTDQSRDVAVGGARLRVLVVRLALEPGRAVAVDSLVRAVWPDGGPTDRVHALQALVSRLRRVLPEGRLRSLSGGYVLDVPSEAVDALSFERLARDGARALREGDAVRASAVLREALELWRGDALADAAGLPFADAAAVRLEELRLSATEDRVAADLAAGTDPSGLVAELEELAARHPLRERTRALAVRALHRAGRPAEALAVYERFREVLGEELGTDPGPESREAYLAVLRSSPPERPYGNLRAPSTSFVGREDERAWIGRRLWEGRLVTLVGPGGAGKTRLATTVAAELAGRFPGGVWLVELAAVAGPAEVPRAVARALGLRDGAGRRSATELLVDALSPDETLIVLDNCEHVVAAAARLADDLLGRCPGLRVLATSRERLGLCGEALCTVPPLDTAESVRLFGDRAAAVRPGFEVGAENTAVVSEICHRLDGLPLAIELAAARLRAMPGEQLAARLDDRFALLGGGARTALPRHRTLRAVVAWSWDLLDGPERRFAARLSVFPGAITPDGAARVGGRADALEALDALADRSLLQVIDGPRPRFRMLETIREYGLERLAAAGETGAAKAAHLACFLDLAERAEPHLRGAGQLPWIEALADECDNLPAALTWAVESGDAASAVRLGAALASFWMIEGDHAEAARRLRPALEARREGTAPGDGVSEEAVAVALGGYAFNTVLSGGDARDDPLLGWSGRVAGAAHPLAALAEPSAALLDDDPVRGLAAVDRRLAAERDLWARAALHLVRAMLNGNRGAMDEAAHDIAAAQAAFRQSGERAGLALALMFSAEARTAAGDFEAAIAELEESVALLRELGQESGAGMQRVMLAVARARSGDVRRARDELAAMIAPGAATPVRHLVPAHLALGDLARQDGDADQARNHYAAAARHLGRIPSYPQFGALLETAMAHLAISAGDLGAARGRLRTALALALDAPDLPIAAVVGIAVARLGVASAPETAAETLGAASVLRGVPDAFNPDVVQASRQLRRALGERVYRDAYTKGAALKVTDALTLLDGQLCRR
ncbi:BTAD domain-containing putative transcriptional regulator [Actinomadura opuntiae]|uniref:BTAD domain-containing putative transcriptional regulator n=1 Tax=Actinomadura sp. OS1-43 TaxID=604315 RepID=UPI00255B3919|nr:BTAD domain-containing putative transcriptional regulator [Actinomadura sp. OS1-43]MDL4817164.1 BTAD domain-containing putative transcriptional regulator [Actinomadura sp. OS1-43]